MRPCHALFFYLFFFTLQAGLVKAKEPELPQPPSSLVERHAERMKKSGFIIPTGGCGEGGDRRG